jgi:hypothetical protein
VRKQHLHALSVVTRPFEGLCFAERTSDIASMFMDAARDLAHWLFGTALHLEWAHIAIALARPVKYLVVIHNLARGRENLACGARVDVAFFVEYEVLA